MPDTNSTNGEWSKPFATYHRWIKRHRLAWMATATAMAVVATDQQSIALAIIGLLWIILMIPASRVTALIGCAVCFACAALHHTRSEHLAVVEQSVRGGVWMEFDAQIIESPRIVEGSWRCLAQVTKNRRWPERSDRLMLYGRGHAPKLGQIIRAQGRWEPVAPPRNAGEFDRAAHMRRLGVMAECSIPLWEPVGIPHRLWRCTSQAKLSFIDSITRGLEPGSDEAKVILAMVMGQQPAYDDDVVEPFRQTGTLHLFSVSGQHVNLVALLLWFFLRMCRIPRRTAIGVLIPAVFAYAWLTGASPPAMRAAWMAALFLAAFLVQRKTDPIAALAFVFISALLIDANQLFLPGVQLSYGIVAVITIGLSISRNFLERFAWNDDYLPRELQTPWQTRCGENWQRLLQSLVISTSACIGSTPLTISYFSLITPISIVTNLVLTPLVTALLGLALFSAATAPFSNFMAEKSNHLNAWVARQCIDCSHFFSRIPGANAMVSKHQPSRDTIRIFDLPRGGGATLIQCQSSDVLLDTGSNRNFRSTVLPSLRYFGSQPDTMILSHPEASHIGGGLTALQQLPIRQIISPVALARSPSFRALEKNAASSDIPIYQSAIDLPIHQNRNVFWEVVQCKDPCDFHRMADDRHAIYLLHFHKYRILFMNDASAWDMNQLSGRLPSLKCDVMVMGRHSLHPVALEDAINMFSPEAIIATHAEFPETERIPASWSAVAREKRIALFHQGQSGMVTMEIQDDRNLRIKGFLNHATCVIPSHR